MAFAAELNSKPVAGRRSVLAAVPAQTSQSGSGFGHWSPPFATIACSAMAFIDASIVNVALPVLVNDLQATLSDMQWVIEAYFLFTSSLILVGGSLGDLFGRKRIFEIGIALFTIASLWCGIAGSAAELIAARALQGIGGALMVPGSLALITALFHGPDRAKAIGVWSGATAITVSVGPFVGGWLIEALSWRWIFYINLAPGIIALVLCFLVVPESRPRTAGALDWPGALFATLSLGALTFGLIEFGGHAFTDWRVWPPMALGVLAQLAFLWTQARGSNPMMPLGLFAARPFAGVQAYTFLLYAGLQGALFFLPFNLMQVQGFSPVQAGMALLPFVLMIFLLPSFAGKRLDRLGARAALTLGAVVAAAGFALMAVPGTDAPDLTTFLPAAIVLGLGMGLCVAPPTNAAVSAVSPDRAGLASAINNMVARVGGLIAIAVFGIMLRAQFRAV